MVPQLLAHLTLLSLVSRKSSNFLHRASLELAVNPSLSPYRPLSASPISSKYGSTASVNSPLPPRICPFPLGRILHPIDHDSRLACTPGVWRVVFQYDWDMGGGAAVPGCSVYVVFMAHQSVGRRQRVRLFTYGKWCR